MNPRATLLLVALASGATAQVPWTAAPYTVQEVATPARVHGRLVLVDPPPPPEELAVTTDFGCCAKTKKFSERLVTGEGGGVANAVVLVEDVLAGKPFPTETPTLDQRGCEFRPHVVIAYCGRPLKLRNSDPVLHNVHAYMIRGSYEVFNVAMPFQDQDVMREVSAPGAIGLKCDAGHRWMRGYVFAADTPYVTLTGADGSFSIDGVPPGKRTVRIWHETLGELSVPVTLAASGAMELAIEGHLAPTPHWRRR